MEETLIEYVRSNPVLYIPTNHEYRNQNSRKAAWDELGEELGIPGNECKENWNKLRNAYIQAKHRRNTKSGQAGKTFPKWKFEDEMAFLNPFLVTRRSRGNEEDSPNAGKHDEIPFCPFEKDSQVVSSEISQCNSPKKELLQSEIPTVAEVINPTANVTDSPTFAKHSASKANVGKKQLSSSVQEMISIMKDNKRMRSQLVLQSLISSNNVDDECEFFFLSMAKNVKKLRPDEQIRVKMEVSNIVLGAALQAARGSLSKCHKNTNPSTFKQCSSTPSPQESDYSTD